MKKSSVVVLGACPARSSPSWTSERQVIDERADDFAALEASRRHWVEAAARVAR
ncbi:MAG: hypothetical protein ABIQ18_30145 [Umezawaea sp.]